MTGETILLLALVGASSLILTMIGLGGGLIFAPLFILMGLSQGEAAAGSLFLNGIAAVSASVVYFRKGMVDLSVSLPLILASTAAAPLGAWAAQGLDVQIFLVVLIAIMFLAALRMLLIKEMKAGPDQAGQGVRIFGGAAIGLAIGFMAGLLGIGGGVFVVPLLIQLLNVPSKIAAASSMFVVCFSSFSGFIAHASMADLNWSFLIPAAVCSFVGAQIGSRIMADRLKGRTVRVIFAIVLLLFCVRLAARLW